MTQQQPWSGFKYEPVRGLRDRLISRYLRGQRKNMRRFFTERGLLEFTDRMDRIRKSRQGMIAKNRMFQGVLDDYAKLVNPQPVSEGSGEGTPSPSATEATPVDANPNADVGVHDQVGRPVEGHGHAVEADRVRPDTGGSVPSVAPSDSGAGFVIEE